MAFLIKDTQPQNGGQAYMVGIRKVQDRQGRACEAADFGERSMARQFCREEATERCRMLNHMAGREQFVIEEDNIYSQSYGRRRPMQDRNMGHGRQTNGFNGFQHMEEPSYAGGFRIHGQDDGYNGF